MNKKEKTGLLPKYRFPEFANSGEWKTTKLNVIANKISTKNKGGSVSRVLTNSAVDGVVDQSDYFEREIVTQSNLDNYFVVDEGDYVYNPRISTYAPVGPISKNKLGQGVMSPLYTIFRFANKDNDFYEQYFKTNLWNGYLKDASNTGARHDRISISVDAFMEMPLPFPSDDEQQKIADCLSSLDELIAAEDKKLTTLKDHKKGLMQKLFPADGRTLPEWRFSEFRECKEWVETSFKQVFEKLQYGLNAAAKQFDGKNKYIRITDIDETSHRYLQENPVSPDCELDDSFLVKNGDILFARTGASTGKAYIYSIDDGTLYFAGFLIRGNVKSEYVPHFIFAQTLTTCYKKWVYVTSARSGQPGINATEYESYKFYAPLYPEQQKIADCLSSIDDLITAQSEKVEELKQHKKALMQGLFPSAHEVGI